jgi:branched-chain amino acid transport system substrate-binding protein
VVKIGVDGWTPADDGYNWTLDGVEFWVSKTENNITLNEKKCTIEIISLNSENNKTVATANAKDLIAQGVVAIVGPENSGLAIPVGEIANNAKTPMIATTATNMKVTKDRPYAFRVAFVDTEQGPLLALVAAYEEEKTTAAIIFQEDDPYSSGLAGEIRGFWLDRLNLTVVSFASFNTTNVKDSNYAIQADEISRVLNETTGVVFVPVLSTRVPDVVKAIREAGWNGTMLGGDGWSDSNLTMCGDACVGSYFTANFVPEGVQGSNAKRFVDQFTVAYGRLPDAKAALAYDAISLIKLGLEENGYWTCDVAQNRESLRMGLKNITDFQGVSGVITKFNENGDPFEKCITIANVTDKFQPEFLYNFCAGST